MIAVSTLTYYPIKACKGFDVPASNVERMGLEHDRRMMVVTPDGGFLTQREYPRLALVTPALKKEAVTLSAPGFDSLQIGIQKSGTPTKVSIWKSKNVDAIDQGDEAANWFSDWLGVSVRLVHFADGFIRRVSREYAVHPDDHTGFADGYPILIASEESLQDLNSRLDSAIPMNRFRPNLVVRGCEPFAEDKWKRIRIGGVEMALVKPCARCVVTTIDKETLEKSKEPLKTLSAYRKHELGAIFGVNVIPLNGGRIEVGMSVEVLE
ncbi:MAG: MOSC domain-containing protein [Chloroflexi bacterium]|nr:MOSC domain-containing protein [Chloroflexota bacterium]MDL1944384.1 MOSC domain-containing protein [Chloroflexi bacterium CFX2]